VASAYVDGNFKGGVRARVRGDAKGTYDEVSLFFDWSEGSTRPSGSLRRISSTLLRRALRPVSPLPIMRALTMLLWRVSLSELRHTISWSPKTSAWRDWWPSDMV
jgi:hypothetical protein